MLNPSEAIKNYMIKTPTGQMLVLNRQAVHTQTLMTALGYPDDVWDEMYGEGHKRVITVDQAIEICRKSRLESRHWLIKKMEEVRNEKTQET